MDNILTSLGLMSGTSMDGIDASIIRSDGVSHLKIIADDFLVFKPNFKQKLRNYISNIYS